AGRAHASRQAVPDRGGLGSRALSFRELRGRRLALCRCAPCYCDASAAASCSVTCAGPGWAAAAAESSVAPSDTGSLFIMLSSSCTLGVRLPFVLPSGDATRLPGPAHHAAERR